MLGVFFTVRKLDAQSRSPDEFPHVPREDFLGWQRREAAVYGLAVLACFLKVVLAILNVYVLAPLVPAVLVRLLGAAVDLSWLGVLLLTVFRTRSLRQERRRLGIVLGGFSAAPGQEERGPGEEP